MLQQRTVKCGCVRVGDYLHLKGRDGISWWARIVDRPMLCRETETVSIRVAHPRDGFQVVTMVPGALLEIRRRRKRATA